MLRYAILTLLADRPYCGYELSKAFDRSVAYVWAARQSQIYPELHRLEEAGLVESTAVPQEGRPDRRDFSLTDAGRDELLEWVASAVPPLQTRDVFQLRTVNLGRIPVARARALLAEQRAQLDQRIETLEAIAALLDGSDDHARAFRDQVGWRLAAEAGLRVHRAYREWCDWAEAELSPRARGRRTVIR